MSILDKIAKIEALIERATSEGEREAALSAKSRLLSSIVEAKAEPAIEYSVTMQSFWEKRLFIALCNKRGIHTYRYYRQKRTTTNIRVSKRYMDEELRPEFLKFSKLFGELVEEIMKEVTAKIWKGEEEENVVVGEIAHSNS